MNNRGQALTLTWFAATIAIFFIMFLFIISSSYLSGERFISGGGNKIIFEEEGRSFLSPFGCYDAFEIFMSREINGETIKEKIAGNSLTNEDVKSLLGGGYLVRLKYFDDVSKRATKIDLTDLKDRSRADDFEHLNIPIKDGRVEVSFYSGRC